MIKSAFLSKKLYLVVFACAVFAATFAVLALNPQPARADICSVNGRDCYQGYFFNGYDGGAAANGTRWNVISAPALDNVHNAWDLVNNLGAHLGWCPAGGIPNPNAQNATGAAFIILTMLGAPPGTDKNQACFRYAEWANIVYNYEASGLVNFNQVYNFNGVNTRSTLSDVAYYPKEGSALSIVFYHPVTRQPIYAIKKDCANPVGRVQSLPIDFNLEASIEAKKTDGSSVAGSVEPGEQVRFEYNVRNTGGNNSFDVNCDARVIIKTGYVATPNPPEAGGSVVPTNCPRAFPRGGAITTVATRTLTANPNQTLCATLFVSPSQSGGGTASREICIPVVSKPYVKVFGGDVRVGGGTESAPDVCSVSNDAIISTWNKGPNPDVNHNFQGAGTTHAAYAPGAINSHATMQSMAGKPIGLSFANTTANVGGGKYGGDYGAAKCIKDYFGQKPTDVRPLSDLATTPKGFFAGSGNTTFGATTIGANTRWVIYIDGDLQINGDITYTGSWAANEMPLLQVVVRGNIFIAPGVRNLHGTYIAQRDTTGNKGVIYTCASSFNPPVLAGAPFAGVCNNKLNVHGSFVAKDIEYLHTGGTLNMSAASENSTTNNASEVFNYSPAFWIAQPNIRKANEGNASKYDAITSLPPVL